MSSALAERTIACDPELFAENLNRLPFEVTHELANNPLFSLDQIIDLTQRVESRRNPHRPFGDIYCNIGQVEPGLKAINAVRPALSASEMLSRIEHSDAWITLEHVEREEGYRQVLERSICDLLELSGKEIMDKIKWFDAILFVTSPNRVTHYHVDRECAWLLQLHGNKQIHLFDKRDKQIVPDPELELFWTVDNGAGTYKPQYEERAIVFDMRPGTGVHIPVNCPHWLRNGSEVSVSMNINFQFKDEVWGNIFKANYYLRRFGLHPATPGTHPLRDRLKSRTYTMIQQINHRRKGHEQVPPEAVADYRRIQQMMDA